MVILLNGLDLRVGVDGGGVDCVGGFVEGLFHLLLARLLLKVGVLCLHYGSGCFLNQGKCTNPSSRITRPVVSHLLLRSRRGRALWKPVLSKQVMPSSLGLDCMMLLLLL